MSNIALTLSFGSPAEAADLFEAIAHAFRTVASRTNTAASAVASAVSNAAATAVAAVAEVAAPSDTATPVVVERKPRKPREVAPVAPSADAPAMVTVSAPVAVAAVAAAPASPPPGGPVSLDTLRAALKSYMEAVDAKAPGTGPTAAAPLLREVIPAGARPALSSVPVERYGDLLAKIEAASLAL